jgi:RNA polymerase sigma-70 factor (ECF subfamily)
MLKNEKTSEKYSDQEIIEKILMGETRLFEILIRRNNPFIYKTGRSYNFSHDDTLDLMQDTFLGAYTNLSKFKGRSSFKTWIIRIMLNNCYRRSRKSDYINEKRNLIHEESVPMFSGHNTDTNNIVMNKELGYIIEKALKQLPLDYRMVFSLREINGLNVMETAEALNISAENVRVRLNRAKTMLKKEIEKSYKTEDIFEFNLIYCDRIVERVMEKILNIPVKINANISEQSATHSSGYQPD